MQFRDIGDQCFNFAERGAIFTPPARRAWRSYKFASLDFSVFFLFFFSVSKVGLPLMGYTAVQYTAI